MITDKRFKTQRAAGKGVVGMAFALAVGTVASSTLTATAATPTCFGKRATIVGTNHDKTKIVELKGTPGNDVIVGRGGSDRIDARGGRRPHLRRCG